MYGMAVRVALTMVVLLAACAPPAHHVSGTLIDPPRPAPAIALRDASGNSFDLAQLRGSVVALFFGFTQCKDICPQTLRRLVHAGQSQRSGAPLRIVMVTVDGRHDTPARLRAFIRPAGSAGIALTGTPAQLRATYGAYGLAVVPERGDVGHTDTVFVIDPQGRLVETFDPQMPASAIAADLRMAGT